MFGRGGAELVEQAPEGKKRSAPGFATTHCFLVLKLLHVKTANTFPHRRV